MKECFIIFIQDTFKKLLGFLLNIKLCIMYVKTKRIENV